MQIFKPIISTLYKRRLNQIDHFRLHGAEVQEKQLHKLIKKARKTEWGKKHHYKEIKNWDAYNKQLPLQSYEDVSQTIERIRKGEKDVLWPGTTTWFAKSSGTTSDRSKFIPISNESLKECHFQGGRDILALYFHINPGSRMFSGKSLSLGGSHDVDEHSNKSKQGDLSAILIQNLPLWVHMVRAPRRSVALMGEWEEKMERLVKETISENITNLTGVPSWMLALLRKVLDHEGKTNVKQVWPNLELFIHGGVSFDPYREQYNKIIDPAEMNYLEIYNASEGFFAIQDDPTRSDMLLMLDLGVFYEFIPFDNNGGGNQKAIPIWEVEKGRNYAMVISTNGGLWRYQIGDTVTFTSTDPYKINITGRTKHFINAFGEEVIVDNAEKALMKACQATGAVVKEYTAGPVFMGKEAKGKHEWLFEFDQAPDNLEKFRETLDQSLREVNSDYDAKRYKNMTLEPPLVHALKANVFYQWLKENDKLGSQNKVPRLANNRKYIDALLKINARG